GVTTSWIADARGLRYGHHLACLSEVNGLLMSPYTGFLFHCYSRAGPASADGLNLEWRFLREYAKTPIVFEAAVYGCRFRPPGYQDFLKTMSGCGGIWVVP